MKYILEAEILSQGPDGRRFDFDAQAVAQQVCEEVLTQEKCPYDAEVYLLVTEEERDGLS